MLFLAALPLEPDDFPVFAPDFIEFLAAFTAMAVAFAILIALGYWWQR